jgi:hypothetical protein
MLAAKEGCYVLGSGVAHLKSQHLRGRGRWISEFEASLVYRVSSRTARATQRNPVSKNQKKKKERKKQNKTKKGRLLCWQTGLLVDHRIAAPCRWSATEDAPSIIIFTQ